MLLWALFSLVFMVSRGGNYSLGSISQCLIVLVVKCCLAVFLVISLRAPVKNPALFPEIVPPPVQVVGSRRQHLTSFVFLFRWPFLDGHLSGFPAAIQHTTLLISPRISHHLSVALVRGNLKSQVQSDKSLPWPTGCTLAVCSYHLSLQGDTADLGLLVQQGPQVVFCKAIS